MLKIVENYEVINEIPEKCLIIKLRQETVEKKGLYDAVRASWNLNVENARKADYIIASVNTIVKEVYKNITWERADDGRYQFTAWVAEDEIREKYIYKRIPQKYRVMGNENPCLYTFDR